MKIWTTKDLLNKLLEFRAMTPNSDEWNETSLKHNEPRLIRFRRINSLFKAFELKDKKNEKTNFWSLLSENSKENELSKDEIIGFFEGNFITTRESIKYPNSQKLIEKEKAFDSDSFKNRDIYQFYHHLMKYRIKVESVLNYNSGVMEASSLGFRSAISLTNELNDELNIKIEKIDEILFEIINPNKLKFDENLLIKEYGFPKDDLDSIDIENW
jgi:hypothetical protein